MERGVAHHSALDHELLHEREPEPLGGAALHLPPQRHRVEHHADILGERHRHHPHQTKVHIHVHDRAVRRHGERHVYVALAVRAQRLGPPVAEDLHGLDRSVGGERLGNRHPHPDLAGDDLTADERQYPPWLRDHLAGQAQPAGHPRQQLRGHRDGGDTHGPTTHPRLAGCAGRPGTADGGVRRGEQYLVHPEFGPRDLPGDRHETLADLRTRAVHDDPRCAVRRELQAHPGGREVVETLGEQQVLVCQGVADTTADPARLGPGQPPARQRRHRGAV